MGRLSFRHRNFCELAHYGIGGGVLGLPITTSEPPVLPDRQKLPHGGQHLVDWKLPSRGLVKNEQPGEGRVRGRTFLGSSRRTCGRGLRAKGTRCTFGASATGYSRRWNDEIEMSRGMRRIPKVNRAHRSARTPAQLAGSKGTLRCPVEMAMRQRAFELRPIFSDDSFESLRREAGAEVVSVH